MASCIPCSSSDSSSTSSSERTDDRDAVLQHRLNQMRRERQSELKSIGQLVADSTGSDGVQGRQAALLRLLDRQQPQAADTSSAAATASADGDAPTASAILVEVRSLSELRPVSRILQSSAFRTELESLVRYSLSPRQNRPTQRLQPQQEQQPSPQQPQSSQQPQQPQQPPQLQPLEQRLEQRQAESPSESLTELRRQQHDDLVQEISELLHSQLVSGGLDGTFRARLDRQLRSRIAELPDAGRRAESALRRLPPSGIQRNDFSHLGLWLGGDGGVEDANSVISSDEVLSVVSVPISAAAAANATAIAYAHSGAITRQLHSVQRDLTDLRRTVRLLLGNQLETQRMIRQEVSAALAGRAAPSREAPAAATASAGACLICLTARADTVMYRCGHLCLCSLCTARMRDSASADGQVACPVCRAPVVDTMRVFSAGVAPDAGDS